MDIGGIAPELSEGLSSPSLLLAKGKKAPSSSTASSSGTSSTSTGTTELGVLLSILILALYLYGFLQSMRALPEIAFQLEPPQFLGKEANLNVAMDAYDAILDSGGIPNRIALHLVAAHGKKETDTKTTVATDQDALYKVDQAHGNPNSKLDKNKLVGAKSIAAIKRTGIHDVQVPLHIWPASIKKEADQFETILHPGDRETKMTVPKFWSLPLHKNGLMTKELALSIGSCSVPDANNGSHQRGEDCPEDDRTIYFSIASYRDFQCRFTVESAFGRAKNPKRIRVGVVDQLAEGDPKCDEPIEPCDVNPEQALCKYQDQIDVYQMEAELSIGPVFARHLGHRLYRGEYYYTQSDAHVTYTQNWDADIISQMEATQNEMAVLTTYLTDVQGSIDGNGNSLRDTRPIMCNTDYEGGSQGQHLRHLSQPERVPSIVGVSQMQPYWAAGYSFSRGHFVVNVPYDLYQPMIFQGEEMSIGIRGFTVGYDMYAPERSVCFHHYAVGKNAKLRNKVPHFWENGDKYAGIGRKAMQRLLGIVHMNPEIPTTEWDHIEEDKYGLGGVRTPEKFYETFGIDVVKKTTEHHLCTFVDKGAMHREFQKLLRSDGMGVDYGKITYRFKDPNPNGNDD